jgi:hypothetical protein
VKEKMRTKEVISILLIVFLFTSIVLTTTTKVYDKDDDDDDNNEEWPDYDENKCSTIHIMSKCYDMSRFYDDGITEDDIDVYCDNKPDLTNFEQERCDRLYEKLVQTYD